jgi:sec-independent protein translocase protein TatA
MINMILLALGVPEILLIVLIILILFGGKKIPELMRGLGQGMKEFKKAAREDESPAGNNSPTVSDKDKI